MENYKKSKLGEEFVKLYLEKEGYKVRNRTKGETGFDLLASKGRKKLRIEVKTSHRIFGIPDMHSNEFYKESEGYFFSADELYIVRLNIKDKPIELHILRKAEIDKFCGRHTEVVRIRTNALQSAMKRDPKLGKRVKL